MQDYIEKNKTEKISLSDLAQVSLFSPWYSYVQGVEVETDYMGMIPEGFDTIHLPEAEYLQFQGQPFCEEDYCEAIHTVQVFMDSYDPAYLGYRWDDENLRIQLEPRGGRGYIELRAVRRVQKWAKRFLLKG